MIMIIAVYCVALILSVGFWAFNYASLWMFGDGKVKVKVKVRNNELE